ncbi:MAG TPA: adenosine kinase [Bacteroidales bacterium]|nr:adenosine kinase [Bacteroidales bacterium]HOR82051.1 adenosine kinase [Bacteroidales bacterium]HPJ91416.1 adenosine kinase [Bacteroidales bacterium]
MKKILGIGNALVDVLMEVEDDRLLNTFNLPKGSMQLIDHQKAKFIDNQTANLKKTITTGGSAANTIHGIARLGTATGFIGKVGKDSKGQLFYKDMKDSGTHPLLIESESMSGFALTFVSKDGERTFATYLGAASELTPDDISEHLFDGYTIFHIEGYLVQNHELIHKAVALAKAKGLTVSLDLASYNIVNENYDFLHELVEKYVDIVFANEEEAKAFTGEEPEKALGKIAEVCDIAIVKVGPKGSFIKKGEQMHLIQPYQANCRDTTGAGDIYASGFLHGYINNYPLARCGKLGSYLSSEIIQVIGPKFSDKQWNEILKNRND